MPCFLVYAADPGSNQTHNVVGTVPGDKAYSPLWLRVVYDNAACASVHNSVKVLFINCPIVSIKH